MNSASRPSLLPILLLALAALAFHLWGIPGVPFHPDETSILYQSRDLELLFSEPRSLLWDPEAEDTLDQTYRSLNAPLPKYVVGLGRLLSGTEPRTQDVDWDWSADWSENVLKGALPPDRMLYGARAAGTLLLPFSMLFLYLTGSRLGGGFVGIASALLLAFHALILLHTRRAMAEGVLAFGVTFALWSALLADRKPWLAGLASAVAFSAKYSAAPFVITGAIATLWRSSGSSNPRRPLRNLAEYAAVLAAVVLAVHPFLWSNPLRAGLRMLETRQSLLSRQVLELGAASPGFIMDSGRERLAGLIGHLFTTPPQFEEVGNYHDQLEAAQTGYLRVPGHALLRGVLGGGLMLAATLIGMLAGSGAVSGNARDLRTHTLLLLATLLQTAGLLAAVPLPFQRFYIALVPMVCLWSAHGLGWVLSPLRRLYRRARPDPVG